ncbi:MAG: Rrf2 family transcriptional regulator [Myxococcales bacterium]|nr:Rrf2 family transcriptional regulator [Myxococcales bacterium]
MQLTEKTDLALRLLIYLTITDEPRVSVGTIAHAFGASEAHLSKVAQALVHAGFIVSSPGRGGGVGLAKSPESITIGAVVRQLEPMNLVECFNLQGNCPVFGPCGLHPALRAARDAFLGVLDGATLSAAAAQRVGLRQRLFGDRRAPDHRRADEGERES